MGSSSNDFHPTIILLASLYISFKQLIGSKFQMPSMTLLVVSEIITEIKKQLGTTTYTNVHLHQTEYYILK